MSYTHRIRVRYGECDMQSVVFNANYLAYIDDAIDTWFRKALGNFEELGFDFMVKKITVEWQTPARFADELDLAARVSRWGNTSFDVEVIATVGERPVLIANAVYVSTTPGSPDPTPVPAAVRDALAAVVTG
ncbi:MAG: acyl-CoA thioester hydrolase [Acidimicrobiaceae bacterium]|jgi:acyl-CoA thioester hydrolase|nr:acyl-CoA thioester hydrolase [Acidimicrobiaceae bacterium]